MSICSVVFVQMLCTAVGVSICVRRHVSGTRIGVSLVAFGASQVMFGATCVSVLVLCVCVLPCVSVCVGHVWGWVAGDGVSVCIV